MSSKIKYVNSTKAKEILGVHVSTLRRWADEGKIECARTIGKHRMYNVEKYLRDNEKDTKNKKIEEVKEKMKRKICYVRVSTGGQKDDLKRQIKYMKKKYPDYEIIEDIGSGINFNRKGFKKNNKTRNRRKNR